ncbi:unnamed protein product [Caenorhabditis brenneri]
MNPEYLCLVIEALIEDALRREAARAAPPRPVDFLADVPFVATNTIIGRLFQSIKRRAQPNFTGLIKLPPDRSATATNA